MVAPSEKPRREARAPRKYRRAALSVVGGYTHTVARGPEEAMVARETLADLLALADDRDRTVVSMRVEGHSTTEIAAHLGCTDRSVRRYLADLHSRAQGAGILEARHGLVRALPRSEKPAGDEAFSSGSPPATASRTDGSPPRRRIVRAWDSGPRDPRH